MPRASGRPVLHGYKVLDLQSALAQDLRQAFADWTDERMRVAGVPEDVRQDVVDQIIQPKEAEEMGQTYAEWAEGHRQRGLEQGLQQGRAETRAILLRLASRRFGAQAARQLEGMVRLMGAKQLARVGDAVVECDTADELLAAAGDRAAEVQQKGGKRSL